MTIPVLGDREGRRHIAIITFEGWNDAGSAASGAVADLLEHYDAKEIAQIDDERYYDYQFTRPVLYRLDGDRAAKILWPHATIYRSDTDAFRLTVVDGIEPSFRWRSFTEILTPHIGDADVVILLGALLADVPHSRPLPVHVTTEDRDLKERLGLDSSEYEGQTGVIGALTVLLRKHDIPTVSAWVAVPGYVAQSPSPKAQLALLRSVEDLLGITLDQSELTEDSRAWETGVNELAEADEEIADYVQRLEQMQDAAELPEASGEAIAKEFERYLKRNRPEEKGP